MDRSYRGSLSYLESLRCVQSAGPGIYLRGVMRNSNVEALRLIEEPTMNDGSFVVSSPQGL